MCSWPTNMREFSCMCMDVRFILLIPLLKQPWLSACSFKFVAALKDACEETVTQFVVLYLKDVSAAQEGAKIISSYLKSCNN
uniref:Saposin B-type domain-containing protein n=1 Tax=Lotus japonicus TaxID=34305 RepID=I3SFY3_LOTJA|nr:unknown [Lotus japonicus]